MMATMAEIVIPESAEDITPFWVQQVLQKDLPGITITEVDVKGSINQGEGFMSDIIAFDAVGTRNGTSQPYSLVAKLTDFERPLTVIKDSKEWSKESQIKLEKREVQIYSDVVPELLSVPSTERESKPGNADNESHPPADSLFLPKCYFAATDSSSMLSVRVMENLKTQGFSIKPNRQPLSRAEMMLAAGALAQLHGLSHLLELRLGKPLDEQYDWIKTTFRDLMDTGAYLYRDAVKGFAAAFPDQADLTARLGKIDIYRKMLELEEDPRLKVLCHADCWINNIMIKYDGDVATEVKLVDWQTPAYVPPTYDLTLLFLCNTSWDVFHNHRDAILAHYHHILQETLGKEGSSGLKSYTLKQLTADFKADCLYGLFNRFVRQVVLPADPDLVRMSQEIQEWGVI